VKGGTDQTGDRLREGWDSGGGSGGLGLPPKKNTFPRWKKKQSQSPLWDPQQGRTQCNNMKGVEKQVPNPEAKGKISWGGKVSCIKGVHNLWPTHPVAQEPSQGRVVKTCFPKRTECGCLSAHSHSPLVHRRPPRWFQKKCGGGDRDFSPLAVNIRHGYCWLAGFGEGAKQKGKKAKGLETPERPRRDWEKKGVTGRIPKKSGGDQK